jgi:acetylornithine deacetylase/succinyl-diaminopimelate desuccinylase-like protein
VTGATPLLRDTVALAQTPAPTFAEEPRIAWLEQRLAGAPGTVARDAIGNLVWRLAPGAVDVLVLAHVDTVFAADVALAVDDRDGWLHGPGVGDNAAAVSVTLAVAPAFAGLPLAVAFTVGEEGLGNLRGALHACSEIRPARVVAVEGHGLDEVFVDAVGSVRARLVVTGPGGHSWWDRGRPSAVHALASLVTVLVSEGSAEAPVNVGRIAGGEAVNAIAAHAEALVEARSLDERLVDGFGEMLGDLRLGAGLELGVEIVGRRPAGLLDRAHPLLAAVRATRAGLGLPDALTDGSTDANAAHAFGIPAIAIGCARGHDMHATTERIEAASLALGAAQLDGVLRRLLAPKEAP